MSKIQRPGQVRSDLHQLGFSSGCPHLSLPLPKPDLPHHRPSSPCTILLQSTSPTNLPGSAGQPRGIAAPKSAASSLPALWQCAALCTPQVPLAPAIWQSTQQGCSFCQRLWPGGLGWASYPCPLSSCSCCSRCQKGFANTGETLVHCPKQAKKHHNGFLVPLLHTSCCCFRTRRCTSGSKICEIHKNV